MRDREKQGLRKAGVIYADGFSSDPLSSLYLSGGCKMSAKRMARGKGFIVFPSMSRKEEQILWDLKRGSFLSSQRQNMRGGFGWSGT